MENTVDELREALGICEQRFADCIRESSARADEGGEAMPAGTIANLSRDIEVIRERLNAIATAEQFMAMAKIRRGG